MHSLVKCCKITDMCGCPLKQSVITVGVWSIVIAAVALFASMGTIFSIAHKELVYNSNPVNAINMVFALFCTSTSLYEAIISVLLLHYAHRKKGSPFILSLWFVSHLSLVVLYGFMFLSRAIVCYNYNQLTQSVLTLIGGILYTGVFIYFCVIVNSYDSTLEPDIIYY